MAGRRRAACAPHRRCPRAARRSPGTRSYADGRRSRTRRRPRRSRSRSSCSSPRRPRGSGCGPRGRGRARPAGGPSAGAYSGARYVSAIGCAARIASMSYNSATAAQLEQAPPEAGLLQREPLARHSSRRAGVGRAASPAGHRPPSSGRRALPRCHTRPAGRAVPRRRSVPPRVRSSGHPRYCRTLRPQTARTACRKRLSSCMAHSFLGHSLDTHTSLAPACGRTPPTHGHDEIGAARRRPRRGRWCRWLRGGQASGRAPLSARGAKRRPRSQRLRPSAETTSQPPSAVGISTAPRPKPAR